MGVRVAAMARKHDGLVTWAGLRAAGLSERQVRTTVKGLRPLHDGVFLTGHGRLSDHQRWLAERLRLPARRSVTRAAAHFTACAPRTGAGTKTSRDLEAGDRSGSEPCWCIGLRRSPAR